MKGRSVLLVAESVESPSTRYRLQPLKDALRRAGAEVSQAEARSGGAARRSIEALARQVDLVVLQRRLWSWPEAARLRRACRRLVYDIDDAVCYADGARGRFRSVGRALKFRALCRRADLVVAGNAYLASLAREYGARRVAEIPTCLPACPELRGMPGRAAPTAGARSRAERFALVWIGGPATRRYLELHADLLRRLAPAGGPVTLRVVADCAPDLPGVATTFVRWTRAGEIPALAGADCGIAPLPDDPWTRGKCALKLLQYGACGLPAIASPVGLQREIIRDGETGYLAGEADAWSEALARLRADPAGARRMGEQARDRVVRDYLWSVHEPRWLALLEEMLHEAGR